MNSFIVFYSGLVTRDKLKIEQHDIKKVGDKMKKRKKNFNPYLVGEKQLNKVKPKYSDVKRVKQNPKFKTFDKSVYSAIDKEHYKQIGKDKFNLYHTPNMIIVLK